MALPGQAGTYAGRMRPIVGFDLDPEPGRPGRRDRRHLRRSSPTGRRLDRSGGDAAADRRAVGDPCEALLPPHLVEPVVRRYRELYSTLGVPRTTPLPAPLRPWQPSGRTGRAVVVSAKIQPAVDLVLEHVGLVDEAIGGLYAAAAGEALRACSATAHVGDHPADIVGAHAANAVAVGVTTGFHDAAAPAARTSCSLDWPTSPTGSTTMFSARGWPPSKHVCSVRLRSRRTPAGRTPRSCWQRRHACWGQTESCR